MNIHDRYVSNFRKDEKYFFVYNEVEQDFVDLFFFNDLLLYMRVGMNLKKYNLIYLVKSRIIVKRYSMSGKNN